MFTLTKRHFCTALQEAQHHLQTAVELASKGDSNATDADLAGHQYHLGQALWHTFTSNQEPLQSQNATPDNATSHTQAQTSRIDEKKDNLVIHSGSNRHAEDSANDAPGSEKKAETRISELAQASKEARALWEASAAVQSPVQADAHARLGVYWIAVHRNEAAARRSLQRALAIDPKQRIAGKAITLLSCRSGWSALWNPDLCLMPSDHITAGLLPAVHVAHSLDFMKLLSL